ncbi:MAG: hypothetical protein A3F40_04100 [Chlamydiae bacterium RIFCSPHIGHO2_12_FULL_27_8]|nr:MAG: hypothetical protein A3F40_04100 [Chlamydiae bacterium RIFCSPHIGHO2_12_FULL_27_8]
MCIIVHMTRKPITSLMEDIKKILEKHKELSIRQLSIKTKSQWRTIEKALETMKSLNVVKERKGNETERIERLFSLKK